MRKPHQLMFLLLGVLVFASPRVGVAQDGDVQAIPGYTLDGKPRDNGTGRAARLRTSAALDPDTVWIGHIMDPTWIPKRTDGSDVPGVPAGGYGPYHVGRGPHLPGIGPGTSYNATWDFDHFQPTELATGGDSLQGWWPFAIPYQSGAVIDDDKKRPFYGLDYGNQGCYVINQGSPKRTFGVTGYWHRDRGNQVATLADTGTVVPGPNPEWAPLVGNASAWCGLRVEGDNNFVDPITNNPYSSSVIQLVGNNAFAPGGSLSSLGTDRNFPGYGNQWDQILYRDVALGPSDDLVLSFKYVHGLSAVRGGNDFQRVGYMWKDPLSINSGVAGNGANFISATDAAAANAGPVDSFTVYIGVPVEPVAGLPGIPNDYIGSDGAAHEIYDPLRRWYSEVIKTNGPLIRVLGGAGFSDDPANGPLPAGNPPPVPPETVTLNKTFFNGVAVNGVTLADIISAGGGKVRIAFRVKTNRGTSDEDYVASGHTSYTRGAAIVDNVVANGTTIGDFESASDIDNNPAVAATAAWKSTGKPPGVYVHPHTVDPSVVGAAEWRDPCSPPVFNDPSSPNRNCNMVGIVLTGGDHDNAEKPAGLFGGPDQERSKGVASPVINLSSSGVGDYNAMGIDAEIADATAGFELYFEHHTPGFRGSLNGNYFQYAAQLWPALQRNGQKVWGETRFPPFIFSWGSNACNGGSLVSTGDFRSQGMWVTSNPSQIPDSARVMLNFHTRCFLLALTSTTCSPSSGTFSGTHADNMSFAIEDGTPPAGLSVSPWFIFQDAFPATSTTNFASSNFDTASALTKSSIARAPNTGLTRASVPGDTAWIGATSVPGIPLRVDLIFRILPGVGNYVQIGNRASGLRKVPTSTTAAVANANSTNFWESYMGDNGAFGTGGNETSGPGHPSGKWDPNVWNSARCDTVEGNLFPALSVGPNINGLDPVDWATMYHESDPKYTKLGYAKNRCFVVDASPTSGTGCSSKNPNSVLQCNVICGTVPNNGSFVGTYPPTAFTGDPGSGIAPSENGLPQGQTYEYSKVIPDGQLTPGAHVQYFYRRSPGLSGPVDLLPDTNQIFNANADASRWYSFDVLPDRWKDPAFGEGGTGMACILVNDMGDRRGDERFWVAAADSIGLTSSFKRGAHNGWTAAGGANTPGFFDQATFRRDNGGQPGTLWDMWDGRAGESSTSGCAWLSNRTGFQPGAGELMFGKASRTGPTADMLRGFYRSLVMLAADLSSTYFGTLPNRTDDDLGLMNDFANISGGTAQPRGVYLIGQGFVEAMSVAVRNPPVGGLAWLNTYFGVNLKNGAYRTFSGNPKAVAQYRAFTNSAMDSAITLGGRTIGTGLTYGVSDGCGVENDVLEVYTPVTTAKAQMFYENVGNANDPHIGAIYARNTGATRLHISYLDGTRIFRIGSQATVLPVGREGFWYYMAKSLNLVSGQLGCGPQGVPVGVGDNPGSGSAFVNFMNLRSANPMRSGESRIAFGLAKTERVEVRVYDVTGRMVKTVANRVFTGGSEHVVTWDGTDEAGNRVRSGVYFYQLRTPTWTSQKKLAVLAN